jgi:hypothetical protein
VSTAGGVRAGGNESSSLHSAPLLLCTPAMRTGGGAGDGEEVPPPGVTVAAPPGRNRADSPDPGPERGEGGRGRPDLSHRRPNRARRKASRRAARRRRSRRGEVVAVGGWACMRVGEAELGPRSGRGRERGRRAGAGAKEGREAGPRGGGGAREEVRERGRRRGEEERGGSDPLECSTASGSEE